MHCIENFSQFTIFEKLALPLKKTIALKIFTVVNILFTSRIFNNLRLPWKTEFPLKFFTVLNIFFIIQDFCATALALKTELPRNFSLYWVYFLHSEEFWTTCACAEKQGVPEFTVLNIYFLLFRIFEQLALALKNRVALEFSLYWICIFYHSGYLSTCDCPEKQLPWNISLYCNIFYHPGFLSNYSACPENRVCPEIFQAWWGGRPPPASYAYADDVHSSLMQLFHGQKSCVWIQQSFLR